MEDNKTMSTEQFTSNICIAAQLVRNAFESTDEDFEKKAINASFDGMSITIAKDGDDIFMKIGREEEAASEE